MHVAPGRSLHLVGTDGTGRREPLVPSGALGMVLFIYAEVMLFAGLICAHAIARASAAGGVWPPLGQPRLPFAATGFNTALLLASGVVLALAGKAYSRRTGRAGSLMALAFVLGAGFVILQGVEWVRLLHEGLTMTSSNHGGFFYLIVGMHGLHAVAALVALAWLMVRHARGTLTAGQLLATQVFWYFVVGMWPILYWRVYS